MEIVIVDAGLELHELAAMGDCCSANQAPTR